MFVICLSSVSQVWNNWYFVPNLPFASGMFSAAVLQCLCWTQFGTEVPCIAVGKTPRGKTLVSCVSFLQIIAKKHLTFLLGLNNPILNITMNKVKIILNFLFSFFRESTCVKWLLGKLPTLRFSFVSLKPEKSVGTQSIRLYRGAYVYVDNIDIWLAWWCMLLISVLRKQRLSESL